MRATLANMTVFWLSRRKLVFSRAGARGLPSVFLRAKRRAPIVLADSINRSGEGEDVIAESKSLLFKTLRVKRIARTDRAAFFLETTRSERAIFLNDARCP